MNCEKEYISYIKRNNVRKSFFLNIVYSCSFDIKNCNDKNMVMKINL